MRSLIAWLALAVLAAVSIAAKAPPPRATPRAPAAWTWAADAYRTGPDAGIKLTQADDDGDPYTDSGPPRWPVHAYGLPVDLRHA